jgi:hypothetical protein
LRETAVVVGAIAYTLAVSSLVWGEGKLWVTDKALPETDCYCIPEGETSTSNNWKVKTG